MPERTDSLQKIDDKEVKTVVISKQHYKNLIERDEFLSALEAAGVDSWDGYECAQEMFNN